MRSATVEGERVWDSTSKAEFGRGERSNSPGALYCMKDWVAVAVPVAVAVGEVVVVEVGNAVDVGV